MAILWQSEFMKMRVFAFASVALLGLVGPALAYENFIPLGTGYSTEVSELGEISGEQAEVTVRADEYETEVYREGRDAIEADSRFRQFFSDAENTGADSHIDY
jgi:hypothetical protein